MILESFFLAGEKHRMRAQTLHDLWHRPRPADNSKKRLLVQAERVIVDRCLHPDVDDDPLSSANRGADKITARSAERWVAGGGQLRWGGGLVRSSSG
jgi:hypothetical protein